MVEPTPEEEASFDLSDSIHEDKWAVAYTCAGDGTQLRVNTKHNTKEGALAFMRWNIGNKTAGLDLMAPWVLLLPGSYREASAGGRWDEAESTLLYDTKGNGLLENEG